MRENISLIVSTIGVVLMVVFYLIQRTRRSLSYQVNQQSVVSVKNDYGGKLCILFDGVEVSKLDRFEVAVVNSGNRPIAPSDFTQPLKLAVSPPAKILTVGVSDKYSEELSEGFEHVDREHVILKPLLLNPKDEFSMHVLIGDLDDEPSMSGRIVGVKGIHRRPEPISVGYRVNQWVALVASIGVMVAFGTAILDYLLPNSWLVLISNLTLLTGVFGFVVTFIMGFFFREEELMRSESED